jgi:hypothetical protein
LLKQVLWIAGSSEDCLAVALRFTRCYILKPPGLPILPLAFATIGSITWPMNCGLGPYGSVEYAGRCAGRRDISVVNRPHFGHGQLSAGMGTAVGRETALSPFSGVRRTSGCTVKSFDPSFCLFCSIDHGDNTEVAERIRPTEPRWQTATNAYIDVLFLLS